MSELPQYTVRVSARARRVRLTMSFDGLVVVVPRGFDRRRVPGMVAEKQRWIERTAARLEERRRHLEAVHPAGPPDRLRLEAIGEEWAIVYRPAEVPYVSLVEDGVQRLLLSGATDNAGACRDVLCRWLRRKAEGDLVPWLREVATEHGFRFSRAAVRSQRTRWASYSSRGTVSLNLKLLFLPPDHVRYVLLHELCHSVHPNHSAAFWDFLEQRVRGARRTDRELRSAWRYVPPWIESPDVFRAG